MRVSQVAQMDLSVETKKRQSTAYFAYINCSYPANTDQKQYFIHLLLTPGIVHKSTWKYTYVTQFCPQPFTLAFNLCGVCVCVKASVCRVFYKLWALSEKKWPLCMGLTFQQPAIGPYCNLCTHMCLQLPTMPLFAPAHQGCALVSFTHEPRRFFPHPATSCHGWLYFDVQRGSTPIYHLLMWHLTFITRVLEHATAIENELH